MKSYFAIVGCLLILPGSALAELPEENLGNP